VASRKKTARSFADTKTVAIGKHKVSDGGHDQHRDGRSGWNADLGSRFHPQRSRASEETEYSGTQSTSYDRSSRTGEKVAFDPIPYISGAAAGAGLAGALRPSLMPHVGRGAARYAPIAGALVGAGLVVAGQYAKKIREERRNAMLDNWSSAGVPTEGEEKVAFDALPYIVGASGGAAIGNYLKGNIAKSLGRTAASAGPIAGGLVGLGLIGAGHYASRAKSRRRHNMMKRWMSGGAPSYRRSLGI